jgi:phenylacetate-CoA ligase
MNINKKYIAKHFGYIIQDQIKGTSILSTLKFLRESQYWDETKVYDYRLFKLKSLIDYASKNVPYYENLFKKIKLTSDDIKSLDDIYKIPILTKEVFRKENLNLISRIYSKKNIKKGKTGGTTGAPVILFKDVYNRSFTWASYYRWYEWMGLNYYDEVATFWGAPSVLSNSNLTKINKQFINFIQNQIVLNSFNMTDDNMFSMYKALSNHKPLLLKGYLSALLDFGKFINKNDLKKLKLKAISSTTETLLPHNREFLENTFKAPVYDQYGCGEISAISYECSKHNGLHINIEHVICEVLDETNNPILNKSGRVVATDLDNIVMPIIRYSNDDYATLTDHKCSCGVNQPLMKSIEGRSIDTIMLKNGNKVHGVFFTMILYELGILSDQIQRFQVYQEVPKEIEFRIESNNPLSDKVHQKLLDALYKYFKKVKIIKRSKLPNNPNGKFSYIINKIDS